MFFNASCSNVYFFMYFKANTQLRGGNIEIIKRKTPVYIQIRKEVLAVAVNGEYNTY